MWWWLRKYISCLGLFFFLIFLAFKANALEIALTFDDAPRTGSYYSGKERASKLISSLKAAKVDQVAFFVNTSRMDQEGHARIKFYSDQGHLIGNHTHSHLDINRVTLSQYLKDFQAADAILKERSLTQFKKWFRFPYLREGNTEAKRDGMRAALNESGYKNAYITINNYDWHIDALFQKAIEEGKEVDFKALKAVYIKVLVDSVRYYDEMAIKYLGRSPRHVLLLHENDLAAMFISDLVTAFRNKGWKIISPSMAYDDDISKYKTNKILAFNPGRIGEIAFDNGSPRTQLWQEACDEAFLERLFIEEGVY